MRFTRRDILKTALATPLVTLTAATPRREISGIYPHLATHNSGLECGTGAVVPWAGRLWVVSYSPHSPLGSDDKLYEIDEDLNVVIRPESIGGTPANRMIHRESNQLFIGPYAIDGKRNVRAIPYTQMEGRPTGNARHLTSPRDKIYYATMEEGFYEVDVHSLAVKQLYEDGNHMVARKAAVNIAGPLLPGYHGKGLYSGQGRLIYANNGEFGGETKPPDIPAGCLAEWNDKDWTVVRRNQFTEVTGSGGIYGNSSPGKDPVWTVGWDHRSVILMMLDGGQWYSYRLPKATHTYDGAHGWNTEWPRIREVGGGDWLMTMHGTFWRFPRTFSRTNSAGIAPRSTYLKVVGDFARWGDRIVIGCDDAAKSEFTNKRRAKGGIAGPGQSQSNLWFVAPSRLDDLGVPIGRGAVWADEDVSKDAVSDPYLFSGYERRMVHVAHRSPHDVTFHFEIDRAGSNQWAPLHQLKVPSGSYRWRVFPAESKGAWIRMRPDAAAAHATVYFHYSNPDRRPAQASAIFDGIARATDDAVSGGLVWPRGDNKRTLLFVAQHGTHGTAGDPQLYELSADLQLRRINDNGSLEWMRKNVAIPHNILQLDSASVIYLDEAGKRWRLPKGDSAFDKPGVFGEARVAREVCTERDVLNAHGTFYELPAENAGGVPMVRPIATHNRRVHDYCSYRGLMIMSGIVGSAAPSNHLVRSDDGHVALWMGVIDDLWKFGKPRGQGGPWHESAVRTNDASDPYLMTGYDRKQLTLSHSGQRPIKVSLEMDLTGTGNWQRYETFAVEAGKPLVHHFPDGFDAYWARLIADRDCTATAMFRYD